MNDNLFCPGIYGIVSVNDNLFCPGIYGKKRGSFLTLLSRSPIFCVYPAEDGSVLGN